MNIEKELQELIIKYDIARYTPSYYKYVHASTIVKRLWQELKQRKQPIFIMAEKQYDIEFLLEDLGESIDKKYMLVFDDNESFDKKKLMNDTGIIVMISYQKNAKIMTYLRHNYLEENLVNLYDIFEKNELFFSTDYYDVFAEGKEYDIAHLDVNRIFFYHRCQYEQIKEKQLKNRYLEKMIFDVLYAKDFLTTWKLIDKYVSENNGTQRANDYLQLQADINRLLDQIKMLMQKRSEKDIFFFWLDCIDFADIDKIDFIREESEKGICFDRAYTVTSNTKPTYRTLFHKMREISDSGYKYRKAKFEDSSFFMELKEHEYEFHVLGNCMPIMQADELHNSYCCFATLCWDTIKIILGGCKKGFYLLHELVHTHPGCGSFANEGIYYYEDTFDYDWVNNSSGLYHRRRRESLSYVSEQCFFWRDFWADDAYKIYMSDHGETWLNYFHPFMVIEQKEIVPYHETRVFSYYNFNDMFLSLLNEGKISNKVYKGYALIENLPRYSKDDVKEVLENQPCKIVMTMLGVQGIVTQDESFFVYGNGQEVYLREDGVNKPIENEDIDKMRKKMTIIPLNMEEEWFQYSKQLFERYNELRLQNNSKQLMIDKVMNEWISSLKCDSVIAIRGGGVHTVVMLMQYPKLRKKVDYIIDRNEHAIAEKMGYEVLTPCKAIKKDIHTVILSSYDYKDEWYQEVVEMGITNIIDIYQLFMDYGIECYTDYYNVCGD